MLCMNNSYRTSQKEKKKIEKAHIFLRQRAEISEDMCQLIWAELGSSKKKLFILSLFIAFFFFLAVKENTSTFG